MHISYIRWKIQYSMCWMWASFCWLGRAPTEPFNEMTVICTRWVLTSVRSEWVCARCVPYKCSCVCLCVCFVDAFLCVCVCAPACLNVMSIYFSVYSPYKCVSPAREQAPAPTRHVTWDKNTVEKSVACSTCSEVLWIITMISNTEKSYDILRKKTGTTKLLHILQ